MSTGTADDRPMTLESLASQCSPRVLSASLSKSASDLSLATLKNSRTDSLEKGGNTSWNRDVSHCSLAAGKFSIFPNAQINMISRSESQLASIVCCFDSCRVLMISSSDGVSWLHSSFSESQSVISLGSVPNARPTTANRATARFATSSAVRILSGGGSTAQSYRPAQHSQRLAGRCGTPAIGDGL